MGRDRRLHLVRRHGGTPGEGQQDEERGEPFLPVHRFLGAPNPACLTRANDRLDQARLIFLTLLMRGLTDIALVSADAGVREAASLNDLVGAGKDRGRDSEPEGARCLQIDGKLEMGRLLQWQFPWRRPVEDANYIIRGAAAQFDEIGAIA